MTPSEQFETRGYCVIEGLLDESQIRMTSMAMDVAKRQGVMVDGPDGGNAIQQYAPVLGEVYLRHCRQRIEQASGCELIESYALWRIYGHGGKLREHRDRESCELTVSIALEADPAENRWAFELKDLGDEHRSLLLAPGDGVIVQGHRIRHWREPLQGQMQKQLFLHYVHRHGAYTEHAFDGRSSDPLKHMTSKG
ncbi:hypothetical protein [Aurantiacibacter sp. MUD61]|uniref:hypothetical protein n=1 Tax=Aurantiacibacter sp. MUD61 TaxID=3009083 RepID=UPI0022F088FE|nr:hypothetical protein [Aurantiacibacter sp. MUD61]